MLSKAYVQDYYKNIKSKSNRKKNVFAFHMALAKMDVLRESYCRFS